MSRDDTPQKTIHAIAHFDFDGSCIDCPCADLEDLVCLLSKTKFQISTIPEGNRHAHCPLCIEEEE
jgi:hypothetical protein